MDNFLGNFLDWYATPATMPTKGQVFTGAVLIVSIYLEALVARKETRRLLQEIRDMLAKRD